MIRILLALCAGAVPLLVIGSAGSRVRANPTGAPRHPGIGPLLVVMAGGCLATGSIVLSAVPIGFLSLGPIRRVVNDRTDRRRRSEAWPDALEVMAMGVGSGMAIDRLLTFVAQSGPRILRGDFRCAKDALDAGAPTREALGMIGASGDAATANAMQVLIAAQRDGASPALVLDRLAAESRRAHQLQLEERTRRIPVLMLAPLTICSLPAVFIGTVVPFVLLTFGQTSF